MKRSPSFVAQVDLIIIAHVEPFSLSALSTNEARNGGCRSDPANRDATALVFIPLEDDPARAEA